MNPGESGTMAEWARSTVSFEFKGGTLKDYVDAVRDAARGTAVNVLFRGGAEQMPVAATSMRDVSILTALQAVADPNVAGPGTQTLVLQTVSGGSISSGTVPAFAYSRYGVPQKSPDVVAISLNEVCSPSWLTEQREASMPIEAVLKAVETAVQAVGDRGAARADLSFHRESGMLIVRGNEYQIGLARSVVERLADDVRRLRIERDAERQRRHTNDAELETLRVRNETMQKFMEDLRRALEQERAARAELAMKLQLAERTIADLRAEFERASMPRPKPPAADKPSNP